LAHSRLDAATAADDTYMTLTNFGVSDDFIHRSASPYLLMVPIYIPLREVLALTLITDDFLIFFAQKGD
jgi:hypothetical protein